MENYFLKTKRLTIKKMTVEDFDDIALMLKDPNVMYAWEHNFSDKDVSDWIEKNIQYYEDYGYAYFLAIDSKINKVVGQVGLLQNNINGENHLEIGYIIKKEFWGQGYALEAAESLNNYAFKTLQAKEIIAEIRPMNIWSINIAKKLGMQLFGEFNKNVRGKMMLHLLYKLKNPKLQRHKTIK